MSRKKTEVQTTTVTSPVILAQSFNRSTNLELDFQDPSRLESIYISQKFEDSANDILATILEQNSNQRVRVLSGSPGLGKSTFALFMGQMVYGAESKLIEKLIKNNEVLNENYKKARKQKLLPVFLNGFIGEIEEAFLVKLRESFDRIKQASNLDKIVKEAAKNQLEIIKKWEKTYPATHKAYVKCLSNEGIELEDFEKQLKRGTVKAREIFERIYPQVTGGASISESGTDTITIYKKAIEFLNNKTDFSGLFVIYDEFGKYLEKGIHSPSSLNIQFLQDFAEFCDRSGKNQCHLTLITHMSVSQYAGQLPINVQKEWAKIEGRFQETSFYDKGANYFKMMSQVFAESIKEKKPNLYRIALKESKQFLKEVDGIAFEDLIVAESADEILASMYPLKPVVAALLPFLSAKVAQNERTLYTFLTRDEDNSLKRFIDAIDNWDIYSALNVTALYQYFSPLIAKDTGVGGAYRIALIADEALNKIEKDDHIAREVISYVALANVLKNYRYAPTTIKVLEAVVGDSKALKKSLEDLSHKKILFYNKILKQYELHQGSSVDIQDEIEKLKDLKLTSKDLVKIINHYYPQDYIIPKRYNFRHSLTRFLRAEIISVPELKLLKRDVKPDYNQEDGVLYYVVPFDRDELDLARQLCQEFEAELGIFILPKTFVECRRDIEELNALNSLFSNKEILNSGPLVKKELDKHKSILLTSIRSLLEPLVGKFKLESEMFYPPLNLRRGLHHFAELQIGLSDVLEQVYCDYVDFNSELINKHKLAGAVTLSRKGLIDAMIANPDQDLFGLQGQGADVSVLKTLKNVSGMKWNKKDSMFVLNNSKLEKVRDFYKTAISVPNGLLFEELQDKLISPPYGIRKGLLPLYISVFDKTLEHPVNHFLDGVYVSKPDGIHYELLAKQPKQCKLKFTEIDPVRLKYLKLLMSEFKIEGDVSINVIIEEILRWRKSVPDYTKSSQDLDLRAKKFLIQVDSATEPDRLIFEKIPEALGLTLNKQNVDLIVSDLAKVKSMAFKAFPALITRLQAQLVDFLYFMQRDCLGLEISVYQKGMNLAEMYCNTWVKFSDEIKNNGYSKNTNAFIQRFLSFDSKNHQQYLIENLADALTGVNPRHWDAKHESVFEMSLAKVQNELEMACEFLGKNFKGESVVAFINRENDRKEFVRLGVVGTLNSEMIAKRKAIESELKNLNSRERNQILLSLLDKDNVETLTSRSDFQLGLDI